MHASVTSEKSGIYQEGGGSVDTNRMMSLYRASRNRYKRRGTVAVDPSRRTARAGILQSWSRSSCPAPLQIVIGLRVRQPVPE